MLMLKCCKDDRITILCFVSKIFFCYLFPFLLFFFRHVFCLCFGQSLVLCYLATKIQPKCNRGLP